MFYGGRLLSHLSPNDPDVTDFISLRRLNRNISILIDSDKTSPSAKLSSTKIRVRDEFDDGTGFAWVTHGRVIENYVPVEILRSALKATHSKASMPWAGERWVDPLSPSSLREPPSVVDKVGIARRVVATWEGDATWSTPLRRSVGEVVTFVRAANGMA